MGFAEPGCVDCTNSICRDCDPDAQSADGFWKEQMTTLSNETEARLRAEVERNTAPFRNSDIAGLCKRLRVAMEGVTPGPWDDTMGRSGLRVIEDDSGYSVASYVSEKDAAFIALAREATPALLDALERQAAEIERLRGALGPFNRQHWISTGDGHLRDDDVIDITLTVGEYRKARAALTGEDPGTARVLA